MVERISVEDESFIRGYVNHIQRYKFASDYCRGKRVLDAGCGTGYGSGFLAKGIASEIVAVDISEEALTEARRLQQSPNLRFVQGNVEDLGGISDLGGPFDVVVNLENLEHLNHPTRFLEGAAGVLKEGGCLVVSSPNGELTERDADGRIANEFHVQEFTSDELQRMLSPHFRSIEMFGQWVTPQRKARLIDERRNFETMCGLYYDPIARLGRAFRGLLGKRPSPPPTYTAAGTASSGDFVIQSLARTPYPWAPEVILAVALR